MTDILTISQSAEYSEQENHDHKTTLIHELAGPDSFSPPPPYSLEPVPAQASSSSSVPRNSLQCPLSKPVVVPQTTKIGVLGGGDYASPFARVYCPVLARLSSPITPQEFLSFIDGLNETFIARPPYQIIQSTGGVMRKIPFPPVMWVGTGLQLASGLGSAALNNGRAKKYIKLANKKSFGPRGLKIEIMKTSEMMDAVRYPDPEFTGRLRLPPLNDISSAEMEAAMASGDANVRFGTDGRLDDPRMRRLRALERYVEPLSFDVPPAEKPDDFWKRLGASKATKREKKQMKKIMERRSEAVEKGDMEKVDENESKIVEKILWIVIQNAKGQPGWINEHKIYNPE